MNRWMTMFSVVAITSIAACGCGKSAVDSTATEDPAGQVTLATYDGQKLCGSCGHAFAKDGTHVCDTEHATCEKCSLHVGSELCCKLGEETAGKTFCGSCGQIAGSEVCCVETAEVCQLCKLHKGSPLCCKLVATGSTSDQQAETSDDSAEVVQPETSAEPSTEPAADGGADPSDEAVSESGSEAAAESSQPSAESGEDN